MFFGVYLSVSNHNFDIVWGETSDSAVLDLAGGNCLLFD